MSIFHSQSENAAETGQDYEPVNKKEHLKSALEFKRSSLLQRGRPSSGRSGSRTLARTALTAARAEQRHATWGQSGRSRGGPGRGHSPWAPRGAPGSGPGGEPAATAPRGRRAGAWSCPARPLPCPAPGAEGRGRLCLLPGRGAREERAAAAEALPQPGPSRRRRPRMPLAAPRSLPLLLPLLLLLPRARPAAPPPRYRPARADPSPPASPRSAQAPPRAAGVPGSCAERPRARAAPSARLRPSPRAQLSRVLGGSGAGCRALPNALPPAALEQPPGPAEPHELRAGGWRPRAVGNCQRAALLHGWVQSVAGWDRWELVLYFIIKRLVNNPW